jgi:Putative peptidoglycan binding domain/Domain of unknown function (DUF4189)
VKHLLSLFCAALLFGTPVDRAMAATAMAYSKADGNYGWGAYYEGPKGAARAAESTCKDRGGSACESVLQCRDGSLAVASANYGKGGIALVCGMDRLGIARMWALVQCGSVSNALCWTDSSDTSTSTISEASNLKFDLAFYAQELLQRLGYEPGPADGDMGPKTRTAMRSFQKDMGLEQTGELDKDSIGLMLALAGGEQTFVRDLKAELIDPERRAYDELTFVHAKAPRTAMSYAQVIAAEPTKQLRSTLAALLTRWDTPCTIPATSVKAKGNPADGAWNISCKEGDFGLVISDTSHTIVPGFLTEDSEDTPKTQGKDKG